MMEQWKQDQLDIKKYTTRQEMGAGAAADAEKVIAQIIQEKNKSHAASADRSLLDVTQSGMLCIITEKHGSAPRGVGSMMFVGNTSVLGSIGGGEADNPDTRIWDTSRRTESFYVLNEETGEPVLDEETGEPFTAHTTNPVPFILVNADPSYKLREGGCLADIIPTLIEIMGLTKPVEMTGESLLIKK